ncbi:MAG: multidrug efflux pump subunit AcrB, partial [bacterium]
MYDTAPVWDDVRRKLASVSLPEGVQTPVVDDRISDTMGVVVAITGAVDSQQLVPALRTVQDRLEGLSGVRSAASVADPGNQITVALNDAAAVRHGIAPGALAAQLRAVVVVTPAGSVASGGQDWVLTAGGDVDVGSLRRLPIVTATGTVPLSAVADVQATGSEPVRDRLRVNGEPAVAVGLVLEEGIDVVAAGQRIQDEVDLLREELAPLTLTTLANQPERVSARLTDLGTSLLQGVLIVGCVLIVTMGLRLGGVVAAIVPLTTLGALGIYAMGGGVLHQMSVAGLVLSLGLLVDNAIVVAERIQWHLDRGKEGSEAASLAVRELALPLFAATGTTVASFLPLLLSTGPTGDFTRAIPQVVILTLVLSLVTALVVTPTLAALVFRARSGGEPATPPWLVWLSTVPIRYPGRVALVALVLVGSSGLLSPLVRAQFFPEADRNQLVVAIELPEGSDVEVTDAASARVEALLQSDPRVKTVAAFVGRSTVPFYYNLARLPSSPQLAQLMVITESADDVAGVLTLARDAARAVAPQATFVGRKLEQGPPLAAPLELRFRGSDLEDLWLASNAAYRALADAEGTVDVRQTASQGVTGISLSPNDAALARAGLTRRDVALTTLGRTRGLPAGTLRDGERLIDVRVRSAAGERLSVSELVSAQVWSTSRGPIPLAAVATPTLSVLPAVVRRRDGVREVSALAQIDGSRSAGDILTELRPELDRIAERYGVTLVIGGEAEGSGDANAAIALAAPLGGALLLAFLLAQFRSFRRVGVVLLTVPLAAAGVVPGLLLFGQPFGFTALLGVIALIGIVVNNAIILIDYADQERSDGLSVEDAVARAVQVRFRPILLTTATTIAGLLPLLFSSSTLWPPLAAAMVSGLAASTVLTLWVVPAAYTVLFRERRGRLPLGPLTAFAAIALIIPGVGQAETLEQAQQAALDNHPEVQLARLQAQRSAALRSEALSAFSPRVGASAGYTLSATEIALDPTGGLALPKTSDLQPVFEAFHEADQVDAVFDGVRAQEANTPGLDPIVVREKTFADAAVSVTVPLWTPGAMASVRAASLGQQASERDVVWAESQVRAGVVAAYWGAWLADEAVAVADRAVVRAEGRLQTARARVDVGRTTAIDVIEAQLALADAARAGRQADVSRTQAREALRRLTDWPQDVSLEEPPPLPTVPNEVGPR